MAAMKNDPSYQPITFQSKNLTKVTLFQNQSVISQQKSISNVTDRIYVHAKNIIRKNKEKEVVKKKIYKKAKTYSINKNNTRNRNYDVAINSSSTNKTQLFQKRLLQQRNIYIQQQHERKMHNDLLKHKNLSITCPEIGNFTFTNNPPFDVLGIPQCGDKVQPEFR